ncbi:chemotaxis protein CheB [Halodesulfovibrio aestuarii]|uniref:protein-glutamate methylesterase n=1 Tax=Halodesulfovibrio aestuarii TaxID=126333 RepID=A0A8G2CA32_9BACT|nr:chemotaxis protein CheB [Halodesulfovibrio aestuarii]SHJ25532.1 CheB methylesterase [Halodesulfovibrio aestuarii]
MDKIIQKYEAIVIGASAGGLIALHRIFSQRCLDFNLPVLIAQHICPNRESLLPELLRQHCTGTVKDAEDKDVITSGNVYIAPSNYHLLVEPDKSIALSVEGRVNFSRPSIDVLFETASEAYCDALVGIILSGANSDGAYGVSQIKKRAGLTIVQSPDSAEFDTMPKAAIEASNPDFILSLDEIGILLNTLCNRG